MEKDVFKMIESNI